MYGLRLQHPRTKGLISALNLEHISRVQNRDLVHKFGNLHACKNHSYSCPEDHFGRIAPQIATQSSRKALLPKVLSVQGSVGDRSSYSSQTAYRLEPLIHHVFDTNTGTWQYLVADASTMTAIIIDPVLDYNPTTQAITTGNADKLLSLIKEKGYIIDKVLETHAHADHLTAASYLQNRLTAIQGHKPLICIGKRIESVQNIFGKRYCAPADEYKGVFDKLLDDDEEFEIGSLRGKAIHLPGHTPDHLGYKIGDNVFCGDSLFNADIGTARCDFPGGSAHDLFKSARKLLALPDHVKIWFCHDYPPQERTPVPYMTVKDQKEINKHVSDGIGEEDFVALRKKRDASLAAPRLLHPSLQVNIRAGRLPKPSGEAGYRLLQLPLKLGEVKGLW